MAIAPDVVFLRSLKWFKIAVDRLEGKLPSAPFDLAATLTEIIRNRLGLQLNLNPNNPNSINLETFHVTNAEAESLAVAALVTGESLAAMRTLGEVLSAIANNNVSLTDLANVIRQVDRILNAGVEGKPPSAYSIAKMLLILSGDADETNDDNPALKLTQLLTGNTTTNAAFLDAQMTLALTVIAVGTILDRQYPVAGAPPVPSVIPINLPPAPQFRPFTLAGGGGSIGALNLDLGIDTTAGNRLFTGLSSTLSKTVPAGGGFGLNLSVGTGFRVLFELPNLPPPSGALSVPRPVFSGDLNIDLSFGRTTPLILGDVNGTHFSIGELTGGINLNLNGPQITFDLKNAKLVLHIGDDALLSAVIGDSIEVSLSFGLIGDIAGIRLKDGTGLKTTIPLEKIPGSPVQIPFLYFDLLKADGLNAFDIEIAGSFQVAIGPFAGSIDRLGTKLNLANMLGGGGGSPIASWGLKPPSGAGLSIDAGVIKGGGFLLFDPDRGEYGGILDIKLMQIGVKAIGLLSTNNPGGWSLLLIITAQLPPIQLGFGFTMTGIGGLLGVQHTINTEALSSGLSTGSLDSFLFPQDPIANAPQIINQLRTIFPFSPGGFVIGPMLELGWGTPSLVTARIGVLIEASQIVIVGQVIVQLPPLVEKSLSLLYLQMDIAGGVVFDPLKFWLDGVLRDSRVMFISLTGQFAFRALFGDKPTFLLSAGGFHPKFTDIPPDIPAPFQRVGAEFSIGIVGMRFEGYFAVTSATVQGGSSLRVWGDVGVAAFEGGFEFNAIIYLVPRFRFEVDIHVWAGVEVFGIDFASVDIYGMLAGPGRWHIRGTATIHTPWPLPDFDFEVDETWGDELDTPVRTLRLADELKKELEAADDKGTPVNWSAVLPPENDGFVTLAELPEQPGLVAHPNALLQFLQKRMPLAKTLTKLGSDSIEGEKQIDIGNLAFGAISKSADRVLDDNFPIAQFTDLDEDDLLGKPSFERFESGFEVGQSDYLFGTPVAANFDYEEVNLSSKTSNVSILAKAGLVSSVLATSALNMGAAGRSVLRDKAKRLPATEVKIKVNPPPLQTLDTAGGAMIGISLAGRAAQSYWSAMDTAQANVPGAEVVEAFEMSF